jgi:hypothetical protein
MSGAYSPDAMHACWERVKAAIPSAQLSGIYANKPGYHNCRNQLPSSDYSVQKSYDQKGDGWAAGALDITLNDGDMKKLTQRLIDETKKNGDKGKLHGVREFFGCTNGYDVTGMDVPGQYWVTSDPSHVWHIHVSGKREDANNKAAWQDVADVLLGTSTPTPEDDDMPKQLYLYNKSGQKTILKTHGTYYCINWDADLANTGGYGLTLPKGASLFSMSAWLNASGGSADSSLYWRIETLTADDNKHSAYFPVGEIRATTGGTSYQFSMVGSVPSAQMNLRILCASTADNIEITSAWWRTLVW